MKEQRAAAYATAVGYLKIGLRSENRSAYDKAMTEVESLGRAIDAADNHGYAPLTRMRIVFTRINHGR